MSKLVFRLLILFAGMCVANAVFAGTTQLTLSTLNTNISKGIGDIVSIMQDIALVAGIGFVFASFFKFHQHKMNPTQVPLSHGITLLVIGAALAVFPHLLSTASQGVFGQSIAKAGSTGIKSVVVS
ncbi:MAG: hypothetical protein A3J38_02165 [Gammaproteobacteria bacterium RIFCSPHIGHO2_12_FULL_45_9]|nr:MAG: hypothetical protein A3J38_02165 [Gammaproteobacteria bacterium RIFCSPHIGHO2_12_FULL_45_9]